MILCNLGVFQMMILRFNLSMAIVCMTDNNRKNIEPHELLSTQDNFSSNYSTNTSQVHIFIKQELILFHVKCFLKLQTKNIT